MKGSRVTENHPPTQPGAPGSFPDGTALDLARILSFAPGAVLEIGCGDGARLEQLAGHVAILHGCDRSANGRLKAVLARHPNLGFFQVGSFLESLPVRADLVATFGLLQDLPPECLSAVLQDMDRAGPMAFHKIACFSEGIPPRNLQTPGQWLDAFRAVNPAYVWAGLEQDRGDPARPVAIFMKGHPTFSATSLTDLLEAAQTCVDLGLGGAAEFLASQGLEGAGPDEAFLLRLAQGNIILECGHFTLAQAHLLGLVEAFPQAPLGYVNLSGAYLREGNRAAALIWAKLATRLFPADLDVLALATLLGIPEETGGALQLQGPGLPAAPPVLWMDKYAACDGGPQNHVGGVFGTETLRRLEVILPARMERSVETGCGKSTILFSNLSDRHKVFALDDRKWGGKSSVEFFLGCPLSRPERVEFVFGPTQKTLPVHDAHAPYDLIMLDGPHGYPFPELEYLSLYPHLKKGGFLVVDDVHCPTIGRFADFLAEDEMFECIALLEATAVFRRTDAPTFDPYGDGWWAQRYNRRRVSPRRKDCYLHDGPVRDTFTSMNLDQKLS